MLNIEVEHSLEWKEDFDETLEKYAQCFSAVCLRIFDKDTYNLRGEHIKVANEMTTELIWNADTTIRKKYPKSYPDRVSTLLDEDEVIEIVKKQLNAVGSGGSLG